jgi:hypothetical protein
MGSGGDGDSGVAHHADWIAIADIGQERVNNVLLVEFPRDAKGLAPDAILETGEVIGNLLRRAFRVPRVASCNGTED